MACRSGKAMPREGVGMLTAVHPRACRQCAKQFVPSRPLQAVCGMRCAAQEVAKDTKAKKAAAKARDKMRKESAKTRQQWLSECQAIVNKIARLRDMADGCISCDRPASWGGQWHGSHFRSVGAASAVRFNLWNVHKACSVCNNHLSGNIAGYLPRLVAKVGQERVDWLGTQNQLVKHDIPYLTRFRRVMGRKFKRMETKI